MLALAAVVLIPLDDKGTDYRIIVRSSFAGYLADWLLDAAEDIVNAGAARTRAEVDAQRRRTQGRPDGWRRWFRRRS